MAISAEEVANKLNEINNDLNNANTRSDILDVVKKISSHKGGLKYDITSQALSSLFFLVCMILLFMKGNADSSFGQAIAVVVLCIMGYQVLSILTRDNGKVGLAEADVITKKIYEKCMYLDYGIELNENLANDVKSLIMEFNDFSRGNQPADIMEEYSILLGKVQSLFYYKHRWTYSTSPVSEKTKFYFRHGVIFSVKNIRSVFIISDGNTPFSISYEPASMALADKFRFGAVDEFTLARFLKPAIVDSILFADRELSNINIEINDYGLVCISFDDDDVFTLPNINNFPDIYHPDDMLLALSNEIRSNKIDALLLIISAIAAHTDSNFIK